MELIDNLDGDAPIAPIARLRWLRTDCRIFVPFAPPGDGKSSLFGAWNWGTELIGEPILDEFGEGIGELILDEFGEG